MIKIKLRDLMWQKRITGLKLAEETGLGRATISKLCNEKNANISITTINTLCCYFACEVSDLLEYISD